MDKSGRSRKLSRDGGNGGVGGNVVIISSSSNGSDRMARHSSKPMDSASNSAFNESYGDLRGIERLQKAGHGGKTCV